MKNAKNKPSSILMRQMVLEIFRFKIRNLGKMNIAILQVFSLISSLKYDVTDAILQDIEKMKVQYLMSLLLDLFETLQAVRGVQNKFRLVLNFIAMATQTRIISVCSKTKDYCFLTIRRVYHSFFFKI